MAFMPCRRVEVLMVMCHSLSFLRKCKAAIRELLFQQIMLNHRLYCNGRSHAVVITGSHFAACMQVITIIMLCTAAQAMHQSVMLGMALPALGAQYVSHSRVYVWLCATCVSVSAIEFDWQVVNTVVGGFRCHRAL